ncbi:AAA family ATPase [bacterium]|nr:AAA family ATPase [bacterium]
MELQKAQRKQAVIKMGLQGPSGSGKTYSALLLAYGLVKDWDKIAVIDSENHSADLYAHLGDYSVVTIGPPFSPGKYVEAIELCEAAGMEVIVIDSISHEWDSDGGVLSIHSAMMGNSFTNWSKVSPLHASFINKILQSPAHIIATIRSKQDYVLVEKNNRLTPEKVGLKGITRDGFEYDLSLVFELDLKHQATASKDRTGLFMDKPQFVITQATGATLREWSMSGFKVSDIEDEIDQCTTIDGLRHIFQKYPEYRKRLEPEIYRRKAQIEALAAVVTP